MRHNIWGNSNILPISRRLRDIHSRNLHDLDLYLGMSQSHMEMCQSKGHMRLPVLEIVMFILSVTVCEILRWKCA